MYRSLVILSTVVDFIGTAAARLMGVCQYLSTEAEGRAVDQRKATAQAKLKTAVDALHAATEMLNRTRTAFVKEADAIKADHPFFA